MARPDVPAFDFGRTLLIGIGAQKAGTTWLSHRLSAHPQVHAPRKEVHYWDRVRAPCREMKEWRDMATKPHRRARRGLLGMISRGAPETNDFFRPDPCDHSGYVEIFRQGYGDQPVLHEFTPNYAMLGPGVFDEIAALHDDVRFLIVLRDPVARFWSGIRHFHRRFLAAGMTADSLVHIARTALGDPHDPQVRKSNYAELLEVPLLRSEATHVAFFETLFTQESFDAVMDFAGLDHEAIGPVDNANPSPFGKLAMPDDLASEAREVFAPSYARVCDLFGARVPPQWSDRA